MSALRPGQALFLTPGDRLGIGPEVTAKALVRRPPERPVLVLGAAEPFARAAHEVGLPIERVDHPSEALSHPDASRVQLWSPPDDDEPLEVAAIRTATALLLEDRGAALVTGPIHKARLIGRGFGFTGHTDFLGHLCGVERPVMAFVGGRLRVVLVTVHVPLSHVPGRLTRDGILHTLRTADAALRDQLGLTERRRLLVCGLNPHAGDQGALGFEDDAIVRPAVEDALAEGLDAVGPLSAEAAFRAAMDDDGDLVVAMYHDQGLAPLKVVDFGRSVNWTLGLPILRTSVDHGTADDIAGQGKANPTSMVAALDLACTLADRRRTAG